MTFVIVGAIIIVIFSIWIWLDHRNYKANQKYFKDHPLKKNLFVQKPQTLYAWVTQTHPHYCVYLHSEEGPAVLYPDGREEYWLWGEKISKDSWQEWKKSKI